MAHLYSNDVFSLIEMRCLNVFASYLRANSIYLTNELCKCVTLMNLEFSTYWVMLYLCGQEKKQHHYEISAKYELGFNLQL